MYTPSAVLIVEDDQPLSRLYDKVLRNQGHHTCRVASAAQAVASLHRFSPDVIWLDWQLADGTGAPVLDAIHRLPEANRPHVLLVTGQTRPADGSWVAAVVDEVILKPVNTHDAVQKVNALVARHQATRHPFGQYAISALPQGGAFVLTITGYLTAEQIRALAAAVQHMSVVIVDLRELALPRVNFLDPVWTTLDTFPRLRAVGIVHNGDGETLRMLPSMLSLGVPFHFCTTLSEATAQLLAT